MRISSQGYRFQSRVDIYFRGGGGGGRGENLENDSRPDRYTHRIKIARESLTIRNCNFSAKLDPREISSLHFRWPALIDVILHSSLFLPPFDKKKEWPIYRLRNIFFKYFPIVESFVRVSKEYCI